MKQRIVQLSGILLIMWGLFTACSDEEISSQQPEEVCPEELAELITGDVERFHRLGLEYIVEEMELYPGSGLFDMEFEQVMAFMGENINDFSENFNWNFEPDPDGLPVNQDAIDLFTVLSGQDTKNWFDIAAKQLKSNDDPDDDLVDFDKIAIFSEQIRKIITTDSGKECPDEHLEYIQGKLDEVMSDANGQLNDHELFIVNNMASVGLSSTGSWSEITAEWTNHKSGSGGGGAGGDEGGTINWKLVGEIAEADAVGGALGCLTNSHAIGIASAAGWPGFLAVAGTIFGKHALAVSGGFYYWTLRDDEEASDK